MWLSLMAVGLGVALLLTGRAFLDGLDYVNGANLAEEVQRLDGQPSTKELADRVTEAAGCIYGNRPTIHTCWYAWADPEQPRFLTIIAERMKADAGGSALGYLFAALPFWLLAVFSIWKASRPVRPLRPSELPPRVPVEPPKPHTRLVP